MDSQSPLIFGFHQYRNQLSVVCDVRGNWFGPIKNVCAFKEAVTCFHVDPVIRDEIITRRCFLLGEEIH